MALLEMKTFVASPEIDSWQDLAVRFRLNFWLSTRAISANLYNDNGDDEDDDDVEIMTMLMTITMKMMMMTMAITMMTMMTMMMDIKILLNIRLHQGGRTWQPFVGGKNGHENFRQMRIAFFRDKCDVFERIAKLQI